ncbi:14149_t:CDS:2 [Entrophospora sp. SA101]|nr:14149_t:CDS:2 [Entrophospora sp. SA101]
MSPRKNHTCEICKYELSTLQELTQHYVSKKTPCRPRYNSRQIQNNVLPETAKFLDLDKEVPWPVCFPINEKHQEMAQSRLFQPDFAHIQELDLTNVLLKAKNEKEVTDEVLLQCKYLNYSEEEINETMKFLKRAFNIAPRV